MKKKIIFTFALILTVVSFSYSQKLSKATKSIFGEINGSIAVKVYMSENLPDTFTKTRATLEGLLKEYEKESGGKIAFTFINPDKSTKREYFFFQENFTQFQVVEEANDLYRYRNIYSGAIMFYGSNFIVIPEITTKTAIEYTLTRNIKRLLSYDKETVGVIFGHGEPTFASFKNIAEDYTDLYQFEPVDLRSKPDLSKYKALLLISPRELMDEMHFEQLDNYIQNGGNMLVAVDFTNVDPRTKQGVSLITGVGQWLGEYGVLVKKEFVIDNNCGLVMINQGAFKMPVSLPYLPSVESFMNTPITSDLERVVFRFPSPIECTNKDLEYNVIIETSNRSQTFKSPLYIDYNKIWNIMEFTEKNIPIAAMIEGKFGEEKESKLVLVSDGDFLLDEQRDYWEDDDNLKLMFNAIEWLTDESGLIKLKTVKEVD